MVSFANFRLEVVELEKDVRMIKGREKAGKYL
jgi:hypothetical protein